MQTASSSALRTVLFDLDGTLLDTAPDLAESLNHVLKSNGRQALSHEAIRPHVSHGAAALIRFGFNIDSADPDFERYRQELLHHYEHHLAEHTRPFEGIPELLDMIEAQGLNWGIVTNKPSWLTLPLLQALALADRPSCIVCGDTLDERKPHPAPMLYACQQAGSSASQCIYIGDAERDIEAGKNAGMRTVIALFGYIGEDQSPETWGADAALEDIPSIIEYINSLNTH